MGLFGGGNTKASTSTTTINTSSTENTVDNRAVQGDNAYLEGNLSIDDTAGAVTVYSTDQGAIAAGLDLALESLGSIKDITNTSASVQRDVTYKAFDLADKARQSETSNAIQSLVKYGAVILVIAIVAYAFVKAPARAAS